MPSNRCPHCFFRMVFQLYADVSLCGEEIRIVLRGLFGLFFRLLCVYEMREVVFCMNIEKFIMAQINLHPSVQPQDIVKLCYQAAFGAEHLLSDLGAAREYFNKEYAQTEGRDLPLYERISEHVCRVNLAAWKYRGLPQEWLFTMFVMSASVIGSGDAATVCRELYHDDFKAKYQEERRELFFEYLDRAEKVLTHVHIDFTLNDWQIYLDEYRKNGIRAVHHSSTYRECEKPAYRIVNSQYIRLLPVLEKSSEFIRLQGICGNTAEQSGENGARTETKAQHSKNNVCIIALDGRAASGKSTMAKQLREILGADIIQMDDFFLPIPLRTEERFKTPGSNVHYERFMEEVLPYISKPESFSYRKFDCSIMDYNGECIIENNRFRIVEGSYSCHPLFGEYADITVFSDVDPQEQMRRILYRNGEEMAAMFKNRWIPLEEEFFEAYGIADKAQIWLS